MVRRLFTAKSQTQWMQPKSETRVINSSSQTFVCVTKFSFTQNSQNIVNAPDEIK